MPSRFVAQSLTLVLSILAAGCGPEEPAAPARDPSAGPVEIRVTAAQDGASTALKIGHVLRVELPSNPLNDYAWEIEAVDAGVLSAHVEEYTPPDVEGEAGTAIWRFEAVGAGSTTLKMRYVGFGADVPTPEGTFTFRVLVD